MALIGVLIAFTPLTTAKSADVNSNFSAIQSAFNTSAVLTDVAKTIAVSHTFSVAQTMNGILFGTDNASDIGASGASRPRNVYVAGAGAFGGNVTVGGTLGVTGATTLSSTLGVTGTTTLAALGIGGNVTFAADNSYDIGATGANRPRNVWVGSGISAGSSITGAGFNCSADNAYDIGQSGAYRPRNVYVAGGVVIGTDPGSSNALRVGGSITTNNFIAFKLSANGIDYGYVGVAQSAGALISTAMQADLCVRAQNGQAIRFSVDGGTTQVAGFATNLFSVNGAITFGTDNAFDIGAASANRPRNIYAAGTIYSASSRELKEQIRPSRVDALALVKRTRVVDFRYKANPARPKIGFIAEETDPLLSGPAQKDFDVNNAIGLLLRANQQLLDRVEQLEQRAAA